MIHIKYKTEILEEAVFELRAGKSPAQVKLLLSRKYHIPLLRNSIIISYIKQTLKDDALIEKLRVRKIRTLSGVTIITVMLKPYECPGRCVFCPTESGVPKSYLSNEPSVMRAIRNQYDPYLQVTNRLKALEENGHPTGKCELIVQGGTWSSYPKRYQSWFLKRCFDAFNEERAQNIFEAQKLNEIGKHRVIGLTVETRPDWINAKEVERIRKLGATRVELGVQSIHDDVLKLNKRGHSHRAVIRATKLLREAGFKITYHMMPNLLGSTPDRDVESFQEIFENSAYRPDQLKIYPCSVVPYSELYEIWKKGGYKAYSQETLLHVLRKIKRIIPAYVRITRLIRDIPSTSIQDGNKNTNLREFLGVKCACIRCREPRTEGTKYVKEAKFLEQAYDASDGKEFFLSFEGHGYIFAFLRLRFGEKKAFVRELHTYGQSLALHERKNKAAQHFGFGKKLLAEAEQRAREAGYQKLFIISGIGVREYYRKLGYVLKNGYMVKSFS